MILLQLNRLDNIKKVAQDFMRDLPDPFMDSDGIVRREGIR
jgi:hypothetical protein